MRSSFKTGVLAILLTLGTLAGASATPWTAHHPRRVEVNGRLARQNFRIREGVLHGQLTRGQAARLHRSVHATRLEERALARFHGGHITRGEQRFVNRQENRNSAHIFRARHGA